jgi:hypothetical protein
LADIFESSFQKFFDFFGVFCYFDGEVVVCGFKGAAFNVNVDFGAF